MRMPLLLKWLLPILLAALIAMTLAVAAARKPQSALAATVFAVACVATGLRANGPLWRCLRATGNAPKITPRQALIPNIALIGIAYLWCGLAFYAIYLGVRLHWQHGWEYGSAMVIVALAHGALVRWLSRLDEAISPDTIKNVVRLAGAQAIAIALTLIWLIQSGKLASIKGDWAANQLFIAGGFTVMSLSMMLVKTHAALGERTPGPPV